MLIALQRAFTIFLGADTNSTINGFYKDFAVTYFSGVSTAHDTVDAGVQYGISNDHLNFDLRNEVDYVLRASIKFGMAFLTTKAFNFSNGYTCLLYTSPSPRD